MPPERPSFNIAGWVAGSHLLNLVLLRVRVHVHREYHCHVGERCREPLTGVAHAVKSGSAPLGQLSSTNASKDDLGTSVSKQYYSPGGLVRIRMLAEGDVRGSTGTKDTPTLHGIGLFEP